MAHYSDKTNTCRKIPQEICDAIVIYCDGDWKNLRLVNKAFEADSTKLLFKNLTACLQKRSIERLVEISKIERLAKHVHSIEFGDETSKAFHISPRAFIIGLQRIHLADFNVTDAIKSLNSFDYTHPHYKITFEKYKSILGFGQFAEHEEYPERLEAVVSKSEAFKQYKIEGDAIYSEVEFKLYGQDVEWMTVVLTNLHSLNSVVIHEVEQESWGAMHTNWTHPYDREHLYYCHMHDYRLRVFMKAAALVGKLKLTNLIVKNCLREWHDAGLLNLENKDLLAARPSLAYLKHLDIPIGISATDNGVAGSVDYDLDLRPYKIANLVRGLPHLTTLALRLQASLDNIPGNRVKIWPVLAAIQPGHLKSIHLEGCIHKPSVLRKFFCDHSKTLEQISMERTYLLHKSFIWMFKEMRNNLSLKNLTLTSFLLELQSSYSFYYDCTETTPDPARDAARQAISEYVTHGTDAFPYDMIEERETFDTSEVLGVVQFIGREDWADYKDIEHEIEECDWWVKTYPESPDHYEDCEATCNELISRLNEY